jgi:Ion channel
LLELQAATEAAACIIKTLSNAFFYSGLAVIMLMGSARAQSRARQMPPLAFDVRYRSGGEAEDRLAYLLSFRTHGECASLLSERNLLHFTKVPDVRGKTRSKFVDDMGRRVTVFWREDRLLSFFLAFLVLVTLVVPMIGLSRPGRIAIDLTFALMLLSGAIATVHRRLLMSLIIALTILEFTADMVVEFNPSFSFRGGDTALKVFGMAILVVMTLRQTFLPGPVTVHRVMGSVAAYLLIGVTWAFGYKLLMEMIPDAIHFQTPLAVGVPSGEPARLIYFSFETLTTLAYGDAYPVHRIARSLAIAEALIGELYPAILIATLVGRSLQARFNALKGS